MVQYNTDEGNAAMAELLQDSYVVKASHAGPHPNIHRHAHTQGRCFLLTHGAVVMAIHMVLRIVLFSPP